MLLKKIFFWVCLLPIVLLAFFTNAASAQNLDCSGAIYLVCGQTFNGFSSSDPSGVGAYGCNNWTETGPERVHIVTATVNGLLSATLTNFSGDLDVYILASCDENDCIGTVSPSSASASVVAGNSYFVVVDSDDGSGGAYDLTIDCTPLSFGLDCASADTVVCGQTYNGTSSNAPSQVSGYGCNNWTETGPERVHVFIPDTSGSYTVTLSNFSGDLDVYILASCNPSNCIGTVGSNFATASLTAGQTYYMVVDADDGSGSAYNLNITCPGSNSSGLNCQGAPVLSCGVTYNGASSNSPSLVEAYGCNNWTESGPERVHSFMPTVTGSYSASLSAYTGDLDVYILASCDPMDCIGTVASDIATATLTAGNTYYIVVDSDNGSGSAYALDLTCPSGSGGLNCANAVALTCGTAYTGLASNASSLVGTYGCNNWTETGPERVHTITAGANGSITAKLSGYTGDLDVYILGSCDETDCLGAVYSDSAVFTGAQAGVTYYVVVDSDNGSGSGYTLLVDCPLSTACNLAIAASASAASAPGVADGAATVLVTSAGTPPYTYFWSTGATSQIVNNLVAGNYTVTVTDAAGCAEMDLVTVAAGCNVAVTVGSTGETFYGAGDGTAMASSASGVGPYTYLWSNGATTNAVSGLSAGSYTVTMTGSGGCSGTATVSISNGCLLNLSTNGNNESSSGALDGSVTVTANGGTAPYVYLWSNGATSPIANSLAAGSYTVIVTDNNGCTDTATVTIGLSNANGIITEQSVFGTAKVYPNPVNALLTLEINSDVPYYGRLRIIDVLGNVVMEESSLQRIDQQYRHGIDVQGFTTGVYYLQLRSDKGNFTRKFTVSH